MQALNYYKFNLHHCLKRSVLSLGVIFISLMVLTPESVFAQAPIITSFNPISAKPGDVVTLSGSGFNTSPGSNIVFFGATKANVTSANATTVEVSVPVGATYAPITLLNTTTGLIANSLTSFNPIYTPVKSNLTSTEFQAAQTFLSGTVPQSTVVGDLDGDGKSEIILVNNTENTVSIYRNTSSPRSISVSSFASRVSFSTGPGSAPRSVAVGDLDNDGKPDLAVVEGSTNVVSVFRNNSVSGIIDNTSFQAPVEFSTGTNPNTVVINDFDGDGRADLAVCSGTPTNIVSIFRNTSIVAGTITFAGRINATAGSDPRVLAVGDLDNDGKADLAVTNRTSASISVFKNNSTNGVINFATRVDFGTGIGSAPQGLAIGDLDSDGKLDLVSSNTANATISVLKNVSTVGITITSFSPFVNFTTGLNPVTVTMGDLDGDGKLEVVTSNFSVANATIFKNASTNGIINTSSLAAGIAIPTLGINNTSASIADMDGDAKPDLLISNNAQTNVSVFRNLDIVDLNNLTLSAGPLTPSFTSTNVNYTTSVSFPTTSITVTPTAADPTVSITVNSAITNSGVASAPITLIEGANNISTLVTALDGGTKTYTIAVTRLANQATTDISLSATTVNENEAANTTIGALSSTDLDAGDTFIYSLVAGAGDTDNASFNINGNNLRITNSPDFETKNTYSVRVRSTDVGGLTFEKTFVISINDLNEAPTNIFLSANNINENVAVNTTIGTLSSVDADVASTFNYSLVAGVGADDNANFNINNSDLRISNSPNFEIKNSYSVRIRSTDNGGLTFEGTFQININQQNEAPTDIILVNSSINENVGANTVIDALSCGDPDVGDTFTYNLVAGIGDTDNGSFNISGGNLRITSSPNFETQSSYSIRVRSTDLGGLNFEKVFTITIINLNEQPIISNLISDQNATEDQAFIFQFATNTFTDVDANTTLTYTAQLNGGSALPSWLSFDGATRTFSGTPLNANVGAISIDLIANDGSGGTVTDNFNLSVTNVNDAPIIANLISDQNATEDQAFTFQFAASTFTDVDANTTLTYTAQLNGGSALPSWLSFDGATRTFSGTPLNANVGAISIDLIANDGSGGTVTDNFNLSVTNVNDAPIISNLISDQNATEDQAFTFQFAASTFTDVDANTTLTYTAQLNGGSALPSWLSFDGATRTFSGTPLNANVGAISIDLIANDGSGGTVTDNFNLSVINVNDAPTISNAIPNQIATEDQTFIFQFAANTFTDVDANTTLTYTAQLNGGSALPSWLSFDGATRTFSGTPLNANVGVISIDVIANDGSGGTVTDNFDIVIGATLPVTLNEYNVKLQSDGSVLLTWDTFSEQNNDYFELSRSLDGKNFSVIGTRKGKGTSTQRNLYNHLDKTPKRGDNYYKLVQVDFDGTRKELGIRVVSLSFINETKVMIYPNPSSDLVNVVFEKGKFFSVELVDMNGKLIQKKQIAFQAAEVSLEVGDLSPSNYLIKLIGNQKTLTKVLVKR